MSALTPSIFYADPKIGQKWEWDQVLNYVGNHWETGRKLALSRLSKLSRWTKQRLKDEFNAIGVTFEPYKGRIHVAGFEPPISAGNQKTTKNLPKNCQHNSLQNQLLTDKTAHFSAENPPKNDQTFHEPASKTEPTSSKNLLKNILPPTRALIPITEDWGPDGAVMLALAKKAKEAGGDPAGIYTALKKFRVHHSERGSSFRSPSLVFEAWAEQDIQSRASHIFPRPEYGSRKKTPTKPKPTHCVETGRAMWTEICAAAAEIDAGIADALRSCHPRLEGDTLMAYSVAGEHSVNSIECADLVTGCAVELESLLADLGNRHKIRHLYVRGLAVSSLQVVGYGI